MSGIKISDVTISQREYDRLMRHSSELSHLQNAVPGMMNNVMNKCTQMIRNVSTQYESRAREMSRNINQLGQELTEHEKHVQQALERQKNEFRKGMENLNNDLSTMGRQIGKRFEELQKNMQESFQLTNQRINDLAIETDRKIAALGSRVDELERKEEYARKMSSQLLDYAKLEYESVQKIPLHERFAPGKLAEMGRKFESIAQDFNNGAYQAVLPQVRDAANNMTKLRVDVETAYATWEYTRISTLTRFRELLARLENNREILAVDMEGNNVNDVLLDTDYWSEGALEKLAADVQKDIAVLEQPDCSLTLDQMCDLYVSTSEIYENSLEDICRRTRLAALLSQFRTDMGCVICDALKTQGFALAGLASEPLFENLDPRKSLLADLQSIDGVHIAIKITPDIKNFKNTFEIHSYDAGIVPESQLRQRQKDINSLLSSELELDVSPMREEARADIKVSESFKSALQRA